MDASYGYSDFGAPYVCVRYTCRCGRSVTQHARRLGFEPRGWLVQEARGGDVLHVCPECRPHIAERQSTTSAS